MASVQQQPGLPPQGGPGAVISPEDSARYTADMLDSLRKIALQQGQPILAHLLELALSEARMLIRAPSESPA